MTEQDRGNPGNRAAAIVARDPAYERLPNDPTFRTWPATTGHVVVRHKASGAIWMGTYHVEDDFSDWESHANWREVEAQVETITTYSPKRAPMRRDEP